jgi:predicted deacetylase
MTDTAPPLPPEVRAKYLESIGMSQVEFEEYAWLMTKKTKSALTKVEMTRLSSLSDKFLMK